MENKKSNGANKKGGKKVMSRNQLFFIIIVIVVVLCFVVGAIVLNSKNDNTKPGEDGSIDNSQADNGDNTIVDGSAGTIDFNNRENATVNNGVKENISEKLKEDKTFSGMKITNMVLKAEGGISSFTATVENTSGSDFKSQGIVIKFVNKDGSTYTDLEGIIGDVKAGETTMIDASTTADIINAYDFSIEALQ